MAFLVDPNVAIHLRDGEPVISGKVLALRGAVLMSIVARVELEGGVHRDAAIKRARLDALLAAIPTLAFDDPAATGYGAIIASAGSARCKLLDRMIAAQAIVHRVSLVTMNAGDYADLPDLSLVQW